eukprot:765857-Hanusia_phi.AAC.1
MSFKPQHLAVLDSKMAQLWSDADMLWMKYWLERHCPLASMYPSSHWVQPLPLAGLAMGQVFLVGVGRAGLTEVVLEHEAAQAVAVRLSDRSR